MNLKKGLVAATMFAIAAAFAEDAGEVWLFGDAAEAAWRFPSAQLKLVDPPEFFDPPTNAVVVSECSFRQD